MDRSIIDKIVKAGGIQAGELVLLQFWGESEDEEVLDAFSEAVVAVGASPLELRQSRIKNQKRFTRATEDSYSKKYFGVIAQADTVLDIFAYQPVVCGGIEEAQMVLYRKYIKNLFESLMKAKRFMQIRIPNEANALESGLEPEDFIRRMILAYDIDYDILKERCSVKKQQMSGVKGVCLETGNGHQLSMIYEGREWNIDAGDGDLPCGEIYIAPVEDKTVGEVYFNKLFLEDVGVFEDVVLYVQKGQVEHSDHPEVDAFLQKLAPCDRTVCELGFGMNEHVTGLCGYTVLDEKMNDTFHIAIGANSMFGGKNEASLHMDLVGKADSITLI